MNEAKLTKLGQVRGFLAGTSAVEFTPYGADDERYRHIFEVLTRFDYRKLSKADRGVVLGNSGRTNRRGSC